MGKGKIKLSTAHSMETYRICGGATANIFAKQTGKSSYKYKLTYLLHGAESFLRSYLV